MILGIVTMIGVANTRKNMDSEHGNTMLFGESEKDLIAQGLV
jgi:hypothetical protein